MRTSNKGIELIKSFEGIKTKAYLCPAGVWTIGYGHTKGVKKNDTCTMAQAIEFLKEDLRVFECAINDLVQVELNQNQFDALISFVYNVGAGAFQDSTMRKFINAGHFPLAAGQFDKWIYARDKTGKKIELEGLVRRRAAEKKLFLSPVSNSNNYKVIATGLNVRKQPGTTYKIVKVLTKNTVVEITETNSNWGKLSDGSGWVSMKYLEKI